jgi:hypothetical protein
MNKGDRVRLSEYGRRMRTNPDQLGTVVSTGRNNCPNVQWDGCKTWKPIHIDYLELIIEKEK